MRTAVVTQLRRRTCAAQRLEGGDPWPREHEELPLTDDRVSAWASAAQHVLDDGLTPIVPRDVLRELWRRGGPERELAREIYESGGAAVA